MKFARDEGGAAAIEAALVLPFYLVLIFAVIELGHIYWTYNCIQYVADEVARCHAVSNCDVVKTARNSAATVWNSDSAASSEITVNSDVVCGNFPGTKITIKHPIKSLTGYFPGTMPKPLDQLAVQSCYPNPG
jgi:Flp pilus assembly protein TadG